MVAKLLKFVAHLLGKFEQNWLNEGIGLAMASPALCASPTSPS
jgi:hypothetical protein